MGAAGSTDSAEHRLIANSDAVSSILVLAGIHAAFAMTRVNHALHTEVWSLDPLAWTLLTQREGSKFLYFRPIEGAGSRRSFCGLNTKLTDQARQYAKQLTTQCSTLYRDMGNGWREGMPQHEAAQQSAEGGLVFLLAIEARVHQLQATVWWQVHADSDEATHGEASSVAGNVRKILPCSRLAQDPGPPGKLEMFGLSNLDAYLQSALTLEAAPPAAVDQLGSRPEGLEGWLELATAKPDAGSLLTKILQLQRSHMQRRQGSSDSSGRTNLQQACKLLLATARHIEVILQPRTAAERRSWAEATQAAFDAKESRKQDSVARAAARLKAYREEASLRRDRPASSSDAGVEL